MSIETLVNSIQQARLAAGLVNPVAAKADILAATAERFELEFGVSLPDAYQRVLRLSDGILENGLTIWPCAPHWLFHDSVITANRDLRENVSEDHLYFGERDDSVFAMEVRTGNFLAMELNGLAVWKEFQSCEEMVEFMLERALMS